MADHKPNVVSVIAKERGHDGAHLREAGERFQLDIADPRFAGSTWFVPADDYKPPVVKSKNARPPGAGPAPGSRAKQEAMPGQNPAIPGTVEGDGAGDLV